VYKHNGGDWSVKLILRTEKCKTKLYYGEEKPPTPALIRKHFLPRDRIHNLQLAALAGGLVRDPSHRWPLGMLCPLASIRRRRADHLRSIASGGIRLVVLRLLLRLQPRWLSIDWLPTITALPAHVLPPHGVWLGRVYMLLRARRRKRHWRHSHIALGPGHWAMGETRRRLYKTQRVSLTAVMLALFA
jgi:hypothetical protein